MGGKDHAQSADTGEENSPDREVREGPDPEEQEKDESDMDSLEGDIDDIVAFLRDEVRCAQVQANAMHVAAVLYQEGGVSDVGELLEMYDDGMAEACQMKPA